MTLYAVSQADRMIAQIIRRRRIPDIPPGFVGEADIEAVDFIFNLPTDQVNQGGYVLAVKVSRMRQIDAHLATNPARMCVKNNDAFLDARLAGADVDQAMRMAAVHAAEACTHFGAWPQEPGPVPA